jgi:primosomal protein N' (replication factor Y)
MTQVAGRAGRGIIAGEVVVQTCMPDNPTILLAAKQDYEGFYREEIATRELFEYPPISQMVKVAFSCEKLGLVKAFAEQFRNGLQGLLPASYELHPVIPAGHAKVKDQYRFQFLIRGPGVASVTKALEAMQQKVSLPKGVRLRIDVNPVSTYF